MWPSMVWTDRVRAWAMSMLDKALRDQNRDLTFAVGQWQRHRRGLGSRGGDPAAGGQSAGAAAGGQGREWPDQGMWSWLETSHACGVDHNYSI